MHKIEELETLYTVSEVATHCHVGNSTVWAWIRNGTLPSIKIGRRRLVSATQLAFFVGNTSAE